MIYRIYNADIQKFYSLGDGWVARIDDSSALSSKEARTLLTILAPYSQGSLMVSLDVEGELCPVHRA